MPKKGYKQTKDHKRKRSETMKVIWQDPRSRKKRIEGLIGIKKIPHTKKQKSKQSEKMKKLWQNPEYRKSQIKAQTKNDLRKSHGRIFIYMPNHPFITWDGYVRSSRLVAEKCLGRYLTREEVIHHIDENPLNDELENLYLFPNNGEHTIYHRLKNKPKLKPNILNLVKLVI